MVSLLFSFKNLYLLAICCCIYGCTSHNKITSDSLSNSFDKCTVITVTDGYRIRLDLFPTDSLFINTVVFFKNKKNYIGTTDTNTRSRDMFKMWLFNNDSLMIDLTIMDNEVGALIYKGDVKFGQRMLIYEKSFLLPIQNKLDSISKSYNIK